MLMDGTTMNVGAVGSMGRIKQATAVARYFLLASQLLIPIRNIIFHSFIILVASKFNYKILGMY